MASGVSSFLGKQCPLCLNNGRNSVVKLYQISLEGAVYFCENEKCLYPFGMKFKPKKLIVRRPLGSTTNGQQQQPADGQASRPRRKKEEKLFRQVEAARSVNADFECDFDEILKFIGEADPKQTVDEPSVELSGSVGGIVTT